MPVLSCAARGAREAARVTHPAAGCSHPIPALVRDQLLRGPMESSKGKVLRLIHAGRMLSNEGQTLRDAGVGEGHCLHVIASNPPRAPPAQVAAVRLSPRARHAHAHSHRRTTASMSAVPSLTEAAPPACPWL